MKEIVRFGIILPLLVFNFARANTIFKIGAHDRDYNGFAIAGHYEDYARAFPRDVDFTVGRSDPAKDWPYIQPGPEDTWAGGREHPFAIHFQIPRVNSRYYQLAIDFVCTHSATLKISINGESMEHRLSDPGNDGALTDPKLGEHFSLNQVIPAAFLHDGENTITLTVIHGSWALYDDARLETAAKGPKNPLVMTAEPLPFFKNGSLGLERAVRVSIDNLESATGVAELAWSAKSSSASQAIDLRFGKNEQLIMVPDEKRVNLTLTTSQRKVKLPVNLPPRKKFLLYIVPTSHTDVGYTDLQERVRERHAQNGVTELDFLKEYPFLKWNSETFWQLNAMLELHPDKTDDVFQLIRDKRWGLSASYANMLTGLCSHEALNRYTMDTHNLARRGGFELTSLILDDVPAAVSSLALVMGNSGVKYFIEGANRDRAPYAGEIPRQPFYWESVDGSRVLSYITASPSYAAAMNLIPSTNEAMKRLPRFLERFETNYPFDAVLLNGAYSDNNAVKPWLPKVIEQWNAEWAYPKMIAALPEDFFGYIEKNFSNDIPVLKTDFGGWWEDGAGSSALETVLDRRAEERVVSAEMLHSLASVLHGADYPKTNFDDCWHNILLYDEHTWGAAGSISQPDSEQTVKQWEVKAAFAHNADVQSRALLDSGMKELAAWAPQADLVVFNSLAWERKALVTTDQTGEMQDVETKTAPAAQALPEGGQCFIADALPSVGYRCYRQAPSVERPALPDAVRFSGDKMENQFYRVALNPATGAIQSIYDKELGRELVDPARDYDFGELIYVTGGEGTYAVHSDLNRLPPPKFEYHGQTGASISQINGPVFGELTSHAKAEDFPGITLRVRLYHGLKRLDLIYELDKTETLSKEAVYLAFPFEMDAAKGGFYVEYPDEITDPFTDQHPSACRDWYSVQRWLAESDGSATIVFSPLDTPLITIGEMTASTWPRKIPARRGHFFAYVMNNYWHTNYKAKQGGHFIFHFSLSSNSGGFSKHDAVVKGWDMFCPPVSAHGIGEHQPLLSSPAASLISIQPAGLPLTAFKIAEAGNGFVARLCDFAGNGGTATLALPKAVDSASSCNLVENEGQKVAVKGKTITAPLKAFSPTTVMMQFVP